LLTAEVVESGECSPCSDFLTSASLVSDKSSSVERLNQAKRLPKNSEMVEMAASPLFSASGRFSSSIRFFFFSSYVNFFSSNFFAMTKSNVLK